MNFEKGKTTREPNVIAEKALKEVEEKLAANPEMYEYETPVIEVDADKVQTEEEYVPSSFVGEVVGAENEENQQNQTEDENFDYSQLGDNVPMGEALVESEDNFWEDFDDDPNAEPKSLVNEENLDGSEDEEELTEDNLDDDIFASLGGSEPSNELAEDSDFDFGDLPDSETIADEVETDNSAEVEPENTAQENFESPERSEPEVPVSTPEYSAPVRSAPVQEEAPAPRYQPAYESTYDRQMQSAAINSADRAMDAAFMAQKMIQQLADQQKSFEENLSAKNQQLIHEEVEKAVEEKIQKSMDTQMERIMAAEEEDVFGDVEEFAAEEGLSENTVPELVLSEAEGSVEGPVEEPVEETAIPSIPAEYADQIELFKTLRVLSGFLPEGENDSFLSCRIRMMIEYIIAKMSGKPGLLITAKALLESGALGEDYDKQLTAEAEDDVSNAMITHVLKYMKKLAASLQDDKLSKALCLSADNILERIELEDQKSQIF